MSVAPSPAGAEAAPVVRLATFYFLLFGAVGVFAPYWSLYLASVGRTAAEIGELVALMAAVRIVAPSLWGWVADRRGRPETVVRQAAAAAALVFTLVFLDSGFWWLAAVTVTYQFFWSGVLPQFEAVTLAHLEHRPRRSKASYPRIRLWGSIGFVVTSLLVGWLLERYASVVTPFAAWVLLVACAAWALSVPAPPALPRGEVGGSLRVLLARPDTLVFLGACALMQASHMPYYVFYSIHLEELGYAEGLIGTLWAVGVVAEIALLAVMPRLVSWASPTVLLLACFVVTTARWLTIAWFSHSVVALVGAQIAHAVSFGLYHVVAIGLVHRLFPGRLRGRGQALYAGIGYGLGGVLGSLGAGYAWTSLGAVHTWLAAAALGAAGAGVALRLRARWGAAPAPVETVAEAAA